MWRNATGIGVMPLPCESDLPDLPDMSDMPDLPDLPELPNLGTGAGQYLESPCDLPNLPKGDNGSPAEFPEPCSPVPCLAAGTKPGALPPPAPSSASSDCPELPNLSDMPELPEWDTGASQSLETPCDFPDLPTLGEGDSSSPSLEIDDHSSAHDCHS